METHRTSCEGARPPPRPRLEVAQILWAHGDSYRQQYAVSGAQQKVMTAIEKCRTAALGGHQATCESCGHKEVAYNSCRNRHCPKCQSGAQARWVEQRKERILPVNYFHVVFTLPAQLRPLALANALLLYDLLFEAAARTLLGFGQRQLGAQLGLSVVLHTWARNLSYHPHVHCIVTGGGLNKEGTAWVSRGGKYLFPVRALAQVFRAKFLTKLRTLYDKGRLHLPESCAALGQPGAFDVWLKDLWSKDWVVYAKRPLGGAAQVITYLGRYTHRVGLSNSRLRAMDEAGVHFRTQKGKTCTLAPLEFIRRFLLHVLPKGLVRLRHYGLLSGRNVKTRLHKARALLEPRLEVTPSSAKPVGAEATEVAPAAMEPPSQGDRCPACGQGRLRLSRVLPSPGAGGRLRHVGDLGVGPASLGPEVRRDSS